MKTALKLEEAGLLALGILMFPQLGMSWWVFLGLFFIPDFSMLGYVVSPKAGACMYNVFHHRGIAVLVYLAGCFIKDELLQLIGIVLFAHSSFDRMLGYGLKYEKGFHFTHLGKIGSKK